MNMAKTAILHSVSMLVPGASAGPWARADLVHA